MDGSALERGLVASRNIALAPAEQRGTDFFVTGEMVACGVPVGYHW